MDDIQYYDGCKVKRESDKALLVLIPDIDTEPVWVPKSVIHDDSEVYCEGTSGVLAVKTWWAEEQGWV